MNVINVEIKARCAHPEKIRELLKTRNAKFQGQDSQTDTYFRVANGRLKLREGNIENNLIFYTRDNVSGPKASDCRLFGTNPGSPLKKILSDSLGVLVTVNKKREIYYVRRK